MRQITSPTHIPQNQTKNRFKRGAGKFSQRLIEGLGLLATVKRCGKYLRTVCRRRRMILPVLYKLLARDVEGTFGAARAPTSHPIRNCFERRMPVDSINNDHLLGIARPLRGKLLS